MLSRYTLRVRVALLAGLLSLLMGLLFFAALYVQNERLEHNLIQTAIEKTMDGVLATGAPAREPELPPGMRLYGPGAREPLPFMTSLETGLHEIDFRERTFEVLVDDRRGQRYIMTYDETSNENRENRFYLLGITFVVIAVSIALGLGYYAAGHAIAPIGDFAARIRALRPGDGDRPLRPDYAGTELSELAEAFDRYNTRLAGFIEREREFTADASHELRTPLSVIANAAELLRVRELAPERQVRAARRIETAAGRMSELLTALLFLAREDDGARPAGGDACCRVDAVMRDLVAEQRPQAEAAGLRLALEVDAPLTLSVEPALVTVAAGNLLQNAIRYTENGSITVTVGDDLLRIVDTGPGIPDTDRERVFRRHFRGCEHTRRPGSGLGLAIASRICAVCGWRLTLDKASGQGTEATIRFRA